MITTLRRVLIVMALACVPALAAAADDWTDLPKSSAVPTSYGFAVSLPAGTEILQLDHLGGFVGSTADIQAWRRGESATLAAEWRKGSRRWRTRTLHGADADRFWTGLTQRGAWSFTDNPPPSRSSEGPTGWRISRCVIPAVLPRDPNKFFASCRYGFARTPEDRKRLSGLLRWLRSEWGVPEDLIRAE